ncbi:hypothetical protein SDC9_175291 [bioreactor metagenome]|uniref:Uncharacterized protein n=1 Tax=bioreactor metagenome TaxID=1076179 RepID=A0A645GLT8_9ZZZZ
MWEGQNTPPTFAIVLPILYVPFRYCYMDCRLAYLKHFGGVAHSGTLLNDVFGRFQYPFFYVIPHVLSPFEQALLNAYEKGFKLMLDNKFIHI